MDSHEEKEFLQEVAALEQTIAWDDEEKMEAGLQAFFGSYSVQFYNAFYDNLISERRRESLPSSEFESLLSSVFPRLVTGYMLGRVHITKPDQTLSRHDFLQIFDFSRESFTDSDYSSSYSSDSEGTTAQSAPKSDSLASLLQQLAQIETDGELEDLIEAGEEELRKASTEIFRAYDKDGDNYLNREEFLAYIADHFPPAIYEDLHKSLLFDKIDLDKSGNISLSEFLQYMGAKTGEEKRKTLDLAKDPELEFTKRHISTYTPTTTQTTTTTTSATPPKLVVATDPSCSSEADSQHTDDQKRRSTPHSQSYILAPGERQRRESRSKKHHQLLITIDNPEKGSNGVKFFILNVGSDIPKYTSLIQAETWTVKRRYNHFRALFENISTEMDLGVWFHFPERAFWHTKDVQKERLISFRYLLKFIAEDKDLRVHPLVIRFLNPADSFDL